MSLFNVMDQIINFSPITIHRLCLYRKPNINMIIQFLKNSKSFGEHILYLYLESIRFVRNLYFFYLVHNDIIFKKRKIILRIYISFFQRFLRKKITLTFLLNKL